MVEGLQGVLQRCPKPTPPSVPTASAEPAAPRMAGDIAHPQGEESTAQSAILEVSNNGSQKEQNGAGDAKVAQL